MSTDRISGTQGTEILNSVQGTERMASDHETAKMNGIQAAAGTGTGDVFAPGQKIVLNGNDCVIESMISWGSGEAIVYKITINNRPCVLKHYKINTPLSDTAKQVLSRIRDNPKDRIVKIIDFGRYNDQDFEIMEYAEGNTLDQYLKDYGAIRDIKKLKTIVKMINEGLRQLHNEYRVIYQDLKPENIYFRDANKSSIILADFGISGVMENANDEAEVTASVTDLYAAPELARKGNQTQVIVTPAVDYFALGITMMELWLGEKPFRDIRPTMRNYLIADERVDLPADMPDDYAAIIRGLVKPQRKDRWGNDQLEKWLKGETLTRSGKKASLVYDSLRFTEDEYAANPRELAALMDTYPEKGKTCLYSDIIKTWLQNAGDVMLFSEIQNIISQYPVNRDAGLYTAILALDPGKPFISRGGKTCKTTEDIADAIISESAYYMDDLKKDEARLYLYLAATEGSQGKDVADTFCKYFREYSPKRALVLVHLKLQQDGGISIGEKRYHNPEELKQETDPVQTELIRKAVMEKDSQLLVWLSDIYGDSFKSTAAFDKLNIPDQFFLLGLLPFLSYKELSFRSWEAVLQELINSCPGRSDLFETYAAQGLPLESDPAPINTVVSNFDNLSRQHGSDTVFNLIRLLQKLGADINEISDDGTYPLVNAVNQGNLQLVKTLLEQGANPDLRNEAKAKSASGSKKHVPLIIAAKNGNNDIAEILIKHNADRNRTDENHKSAYNYAVENGNTKLIKLLDPSLMARINHVVMNVKSGFTTGRYLKKITGWLCDRDGKNTKKSNNQNNKKKCVRFIAILFGLICGFGIAWITAWFLSRMGINDHWIGMGFVPALALVSVITYNIWRSKKIFFIILLLLLAVPGCLLRAAPDYFNALVSRVSMAVNTKTEKPVTAEPAALTAIVTSDGLNFRAEPSGSAEVIKTLKKDDMLIVTGEVTGNGWIPVKHDTDSGYVSADYVSVSESPNTLPVNISGIVQNVKNILTEYTWAKYAVGGGILAVIAAVTCVVRAKKKKNNLKKVSIKNFFLGLYTVIPKIFAVIMVIAAVYSAVTEGMPLFNLLLMIGIAVLMFAVNIAGWILMIIILFFLFRTFLF